MCTVGYGAPIPPDYPRPYDTTFPANGMFLSQYWLFRLGDMRLELVPDEAASAQLALDVLRPTMTLAPGDMLYATNCNPQIDPACGTYRVRISDPDMVAPATPVVTSVRTLLVRDPVDGGALSCGDQDSLELTIVTSDDDATGRDIGLVAYLARTEAELALTTEPAIAFGFDYIGDDAPTSTIVLGDSVGRQRDGEPFRSADPFCFAVAAFDRAGNVSARSTATCLDTTDENDPTVEFVASTGGCCSSQRAVSGDWLAVLLVALVLTGTGRACRRGSHAASCGSRCRRA